MAATTGGALKQLIEAAGLGLSAYRRKVPSDAALPYVVITDGISEQTIDQGDNSADDDAVENVQVDLYQQYYDVATRTVIEDQVLAKALKRAMHGKRLTAAPEHVYAVKVPFNTTSMDADDNTVRTRYSVNILRSL